MNLLWVFLLSCSLSWVLTGLLRRYALAISLLDIPNERSSHAIPTPRGGGLAIVLSFYVALFTLYWLGHVEAVIFYGLLGLASVAVIGIIDDHDHIPARYRLLIHFGAAAWTCYWLGIIPWGDEGLFLYIFSGISLLYLVWLLNLYNFMDGIDGIATVEAITVISSATLLLFINGNETHLDLMMVLLAALSGFLFWNWPPAKIFMGDVGSAFIGILLGSFSLITANSGSLDFTIWLILLAVFITDATYTLLVRLFAGEKIYEAHHSHAYQHLSRQYGHKSVTIGVLSINIIWLLPLAWLADHYDQLLLCFLLAYAPLIVWAIKSHAGTPDEE